MKINDIVKVKSIKHCGIVPTENWLVGHNGVVTDVRDKSVHVIFPRHVVEKNKYYKPYYDLNKFSYGWWFNGNNLEIVE